MSHPILYPRGTLLIVNGKQTYVPVDGYVDGEIAKICARENEGKEGDALIDNADFEIRPLFDKQWCGPVDLSSDGVESLDDWDTAFAKQQVKKLAGEVKTADDGVAQAA